VENQQSDSELTASLSKVVAIVLDWNGTAVNDIRRALAATNRVLAEMAIPALSLERFHETFRLPMDSYFSALGVLKVDIEEAVADWNRFLVGGPIELSSGVLEMLKAAERAGIPVGVVSAASPDVVRADARVLGIERSLSLIVGNARVKSAALREISTELGGLVLYCGDTEYDMIEAKIAGALPVAFAGGYRSAADLLKTEPLLVIEDFFEIARGLNALALTGGGMPRASAD
jgi:phosphoglycolate phosphatase-like HAD superfamily hydrolase